MSDDKNLVAAGDVIDGLEAIRRNDRSPAYDYGEPRPDGETRRGGKWLTPREIAEQMLQHRGGLIRLTARERDMVLYALEACPLPRIKDSTCDYTEADEAEFQGLAHRIRGAELGEEAV